MKAFIVPTLNNEHRAQCYQWRVLTQDILNSPTLCQHHVHQALQPPCLKSPSQVIHYMNDIVIAAPPPNWGSAPTSSHEMEARGLSLDQ
jgi:hypothetical protein